MGRSRCLRAALLIGIALLHPCASIAQQYDWRLDILRRQIREIGAGFVGHVKSATADTVTVTSDGSYGVIKKRTEYTFHITPDTMVFHMREDGEFKQPHAFHANELRAAEFVGVNYDDRGGAHIALRIYTLPLSVADRPPTGPAVGPLVPPPPPQDMSPAMQQRYLQGYAGWREIEQVSGGQFVGLVQSATADTVTVISDRDSSIYLRKGTQYTFHITPDTKVKSDGPSHGNELRGGQRVTIRYRDMGDTHVALNIHIWPTFSVIDAPPSPGQP
jgi:hypothetical protein